MKWRRSGWPRKVSDWCGRFAMTKRDLGGAPSVKRGTIVQITNSARSDKLEVCGQPCPHCGVQPCSSLVSWEDLTILPKAFEGFGGQPDG